MFLYGLFFISNIFDYISDYKKILNLRLLCKEFNQNILYFLKIDSKLPVIQANYVNITNCYCMNCGKKKYLEYIQFEDFFNMEDNFFYHIFVSCKHWECKFKIVRSYLFYLLSKNVIHSSIYYKNIRVAINNNNKKRIGYINNENFIILKENRIQLKTFWYDKTTPHHYNITNVDLLELYNTNKFLPDISKFLFFSFYPNWIREKYMEYIKNVIKQQKIFYKNAIYYHNSNKDHCFSEYYLSPFTDNQIKFYWLIQWIAYKKAKFKHNNICIYKILSSTKPEKIKDIIQEYFLNHTMINENELILRGKVLKFINNKKILNKLLQNNSMIINMDDIKNKLGCLIMVARNELKYGL